MRLVDRDQRQLDPGQPIKRARHQQAFRRHVQQIEQAVGEQAGGLAALVRIDLAMQRRRGHAQLTQGRHLIVHQGDQWRYDNGCACPAEGRDLVAQALAPARRHQHQRVAPGQDLIDRRLLQAAECGETEDLPQYRLRIGSDAH